MTRFQGRSHEWGARSRRAGIVVLTALSASLAGCDLDDLLTVPDPEVATPDVLEGEAALPILLAGAQSDFQVAFSGSAGAEGQIAMSGLFTDELHYTSTFSTRIQVDRRAINDTNDIMEFLHRELQRARASADRAATSFAEFGPDRPGRAESLNLLGYTYVFFAEHYCSGVPFSRLTETGATEYGAPQTTVQMLEAAVAAFEAALNASETADSEDQANLARVGLGRALLDLGRFAEAGAAVAAVPTSFVYQIMHSDNSSRQNNAMFSFQYIEGRWSVADRQGTNGLPYRSSSDPRVPWFRSTGSDSVAFDNSPLYLQRKYSSRSSPSILASGVEARLIEAEAALQAGASGTFINTLNALRAAPPAYYDRAVHTGIDQLTPLALPDAGARVDLLFRERAYWMYATAHRLGDLRRMIRQYGRTEDQVFPIGAYGVWDPNKSGDYGNDVNFPIPRDEGNNPLIEEHSDPSIGFCLDRTA